MPLLYVQRRKSRRVLFGATVDALIHYLHSHSDSGFTLLPIFDKILRKLLEVFAATSTKWSMELRKLRLKLLKIFAFDCEFAGLPFNLFVLLLHLFIDGSWVDCREAFLYIIK